MAIPDDFAPRPTVPTGGLERMLQIWEAARDINGGGYGGSVLHRVASWGTPGGKGTTSCSPFTATCIGMMFDPSGAIDAATEYAPVINHGAGTVPLPVDFYRLHNGFYFQVDSDDPHSAATVAKRKQQFHDHHWPLCDDSALSTAFFNLGYRIDLRDVRRGDLIGIDFVSGHGHAAFVWDVHTSAAGEVDCLQFLSANGYSLGGGKYCGPGVSVSAPGDAAAFIDQANGTFTKKFPLFVDNELYVTGAYWYCRPGVARKDVDLATFRAPVPPANIFDKANDGGRAMADVRAVRFWGFAPPDAPHGTVLPDDRRELAAQLARWPAPAPYAVKR
jgi:hypothetical protein